MQIPPEEVRRELDTDGGEGGAEGAEGAAEGASSRDMLVAVADPGCVYRTRRGHQCRGCLLIVLYYMSLRGAST